MLQQASVKPITRISKDDWHALIARGDPGRRPLLVSEAFLHSEAVKTWTPQGIGAQFEDLRVPVAIGLPQQGSPYENPMASSFRHTTLGEFVRSLPDNPGSYLVAAAMAKFPGLAEELGIDQAVAPPLRSQNLWIGNATQSGLHFDMGDGLLAQVYGVKSAMLVPAGNFANVYPYADIHTKSRVDPRDFDRQKFPRFARVERYAATLVPGDALYIPRLWWHHLTSADLSISVNAWFGKAHRKDLPLTILRAGPAVWRQTIHDFVAMGFGKREFEQRMFVSTPSGLWLYQLLKRMAGR